MTSAFLDTDPRIIALALFGLALMLAVALEKLLSRYWLSLPIVYVAAGRWLRSRSASRPSIPRATASMRPHWNTAPSSSSSFR